ncbi:MAG TPA: O-antigen ligase family protein [Candidatus Limnocylindrales bacterium]|nr:O-antigen ligase family protein [Candidatus Limnocylindrales bacterium]
MRRDLLIFVAALLALAAALGVAGATAADAALTLRGVEDATQSAELPNWMPRLGVNADLRLYEGDELGTALDRMRAAHITWVRQTIPWSSVEAVPGQFDWSRWDTLLTPFATDPDLRVVAVLQGAPAWAADPSAPNAETAPPAEPAAFARFAAAFAERYGAFVDLYQIWDEPNLEAGWGGLEPIPASYLALLAAAYEAIHGADARASVLAAGLAPTTETGPRNLSDVLYLDALLALGGGLYMDAAAGKPFGFDLSPMDRTTSPDVLNFSRLILLREVLLKHNLGSMPLWATGWGWNTLPADWPGAPSIWGTVTPEQQSAYTVEALDRAEREWPWIGGMTLHTWQPDAAPDDPKWGFALVGPDGLTGALYDALAARPAQTQAANGLYAPANPFAEYSGAWRFGPLGADIGPYQDSQAVLNFTGREVALKLRQDDFVAYLFAEVDGEPANGLPQGGDGNAYVILTSGTRQPELGLTTLATGLADGPHTLRLIADRGWDRWALAGYAVSDGDLAAPYRNQLAVAVFGVIAATVAVLVSAIRLDWGMIGRAASRVWAMLGVAGQLLLSAIAALVLMLGMLLSVGGLLPDLLRRDPAAFGLTAGAALLLYLSPPLFVSAIAGIALFVIFYHRPELGLMLTIFFAPFYLFPVELYRFAFPMAELVLLLLAGAWLLRQAADWARTRKSDTSGSSSVGLVGVLRQLAVLDMCVAAYLALGAAALFVSPLRGPALTELRVLFIEPALFYLILRRTAQREGVLLSIVDSLVAAAVVVSVVGLVQYAFGQSVVIAEGGTSRLAGVYGSPNNAALFLERALPFAVIMQLIRFDARRRWFGAAAAAVISAALAFTFSAGALFLGVPLSLALVLLLQYGRRAFLILSGLALLLGGVLLVALQSERFARLANFSGGTSFFRVRVWQSAAQMLRDHPITGIGLDQFLYAYRGQYIAPDAWQEPNLSHPHNVLLDFWLRLGLLGAALLVVIQIAFWGRAVRVWRKHGPSAFIARALIIGAMGSMIGLLAHGMVDNSVFVNDLALVFMLLLAIPASLPVLPAPADSPLGL